MLERDLIHKFMEELTKIEPNCWRVKIHGQPFQTRGIPDVLICYKGLFIGVEFKIVRQGKMNVTPYQQYTLEKIHKAGGFPVIVWFNLKSNRYGVIKESFKTIKETVKYFCNTAEKLSANVGIDFSECAPTPCSVSVPKE